jgi:predicted ABC-type sugar transport system permease subunit
MGRGWPERPGEGQPQTPINESAGYFKARSSTPQFSKDKATKMTAQNRIYIIAMLICIVLIYDIWWTGFFTYVRQKEPEESMAAILHSIRVFLSADIIFLIFAGAFSRDVTSVFKLWSVTVLLAFVARMGWLFNAQKPAENLNPLVAMFDAALCMIVLLVGIVIMFTTRWLSRKLSPPTAAKP